MVDREGEIGKMRAMESEIIALRKTLVEFGETLEWIGSDCEEPWSAANDALNRAGWFELDRSKWGKW